MQQGRCRPIRHAEITVRGTGDHAFEQSQHAAYARDAVQRRDEMQFRSARIGEADIDAASQQGFDETFCAVHFPPRRTAQVAVDMNLVTRYPSMASDPPSEP